MPAPGAAVRAVNPSVPDTGRLMLDIRSLGKNYGNRAALQGVSLGIPASCLAVLLGPNGAGKSTLFQVLTGLFAADAGEVDVAGHSMRHEAVRALATSAWCSSRCRSTST